MAIEIDSEAPDFKKELNKLIHYIMFALLQNRIKKLQLNFINIRLVHYFNKNEQFQPELRETILYLIFAIST